MKISVIIATDGRRASLKGVLEDLSDKVQRTELDYEVLVVENGGRREAEAVVELCRPILGRPLRYRYLPRPSKVAALTAGMQAAEGTHFAFTDDDVRIDPGWIHALFRTFDDWGCDAVGGRVVPIYEIPLPEWIDRNRDLFTGPLGDYSLGEETFPYDETMPPFAGANMAVLREAMDNVGGFRLDLGPGTGTNGEDSDLFYRLRRKGKRIFYCGSAIVYHPTPHSRVCMAYLARWYRAAGRCAARWDREALESEGAHCRALFPGYVFKGLISQGLGMIKSGLRGRQERTYLRHWRAFQRYRGMLEGWWRPRRSRES